MKARIRTETFMFEYSGPPRLWNEVFRPIVGGAKSPEEEEEPEPEPVAQPAPPVRPTAGPLTPVGPSPFAAAPRPAGPEAYGDVDVRPTRQRPPRENRQARWSARDEDRGRPSRPRDGGGRQQEPRSRRNRPAPQAPPIQPSGNPEELYARLKEVPGRRQEKDAVLAAVWFVSRGDRPVQPEEIERHLKDHGGPEGIKVRPLLQKHVNRSKMLDAGEEPGTFQLNRKGAHYVVDNLVGT